MSAGTPLLRPLLAIAAVAMAVFAAVPTSLLKRTLALGQARSASVLLEHRYALATAAGIAIAVAWGAAAYARRRLPFEEARFWVWWREPQRELPTWRELCHWGLVALAFALVFEGPSLAWSDFESDDFRLLNQDDELPLGRLLVATHNDHTIPLLRLELRFWRTLFGVWPLPYNVAMFAVFTLLLWAMAVALRMFGASRAGILLALGLCAGWTLWGQMTSGGYIFQKYMQITVCGVLTAACWHGLQRTGKSRFGWGLLGCTLWSVALNVSGFWVPCAAAASALCDLRSKPGSPQDSFRQRGLWLAAVALAALVFAALHAWMYSLPGNEAFLSLAREKAGLLDVAGQVKTLVGASILSIVLPTPHHLARLKAFEAAILLAWLTGAIALAIAFYVGRDLRRPLAACTLVLLGIALMVSVGRPNTESASIIGAKYLGPIYVWTCLLVALVFESCQRTLAENSRRTALKATALLVLFSWMAHSALNVAHYLDVPFFRRDISRVSQWREHGRERAALDELRHKLCAPLEAADMSPFTIPDVSGPELCRVYPALAYHWGEEPPLSSYRAVLFREPKRWSFVEGEVDRSRISPAFWRLVADDPTLQALYTTPQD